MRTLISREQKSLINCAHPVLFSLRDHTDHHIDDYYNSEFHFCKPPGGAKGQHEGLGSILFGDRIFNSPYEINMLERNATCTELCTVRDIPAHDAKFINDRIREDYALNWLIDGLPAAEMKQDLRSGDLFFDMGFNLGQDEGEFSEERPALNNHYEVVLRRVGVGVWGRCVS